MSTSTDRRQFLETLIAVAAAPAIVRAESLMRIRVPHIYLFADGVRPDNDALHAWLFGKPVLWARDGKRVSRHIRGEVFALHSPFFLPFDDRLVPGSLTHSKFNWVKQ